VRLGASGDAASQLLVANHMPLLRDGRLTRRCRAYACHRTTRSRPLLTSRNAKGKSLALVAVSQNRSSTFRCRVAMRGKLGRISRRRLAVSQKVGGSFLLPFTICRLCGGNLRRAFSMSENTGGISQQPFAIPRNVGGDFREDFAIRKTTHRNSGEQLLISGTGMEIIKVRSFSLID
jgi:hypothetical protein